MRFRQEDVDEDEAEDADRAVEKERDEGAEVCVELLECFCHNKPPKVRCHVGYCVSPPTRPDWQNFCGHDPRQAPHAHVERDGKDDQNRKRQPSDVIHVRVGGWIVSSDVVQDVEIDAHRNLGNRHSQFTHEQKDSSADMFFEHKPKDG